MDSNGAETVGGGGKRQRTEDDAGNVGTKGKEQLATSRCVRGAVAMDSDDTEGAELPPVVAEEENMTGAGTKLRVERAQHDRRRRHLA